MNIVMFAGEINTTWENLGVVRPLHPASNSFFEKYNLADNVRFLTLNLWISPHHSPNT